MQSIDTYYAILLASNNQKDKISSEGIKYFFDEQDGMYFDGNYDKYATKEQAFEVYKKYPELENSGLVVKVVDIKIIELVED